jgi:hypothetical protein
MQTFRQSRHVRSWANSCRATRLFQIIPQYLQPAPKGLSDKRLMRLRESVLRSRGSMDPLKSPVLVAPLRRAQTGEVGKLSP